MILNRDLQSNKKSKLILRLKLGAVLGFPPDHLAAALLEFVLLVGWLAAVVDRLVAHAVVFRYLLAFDLLGLPAVVVAVSLAFVLLPLAAVFLARLLVLGDKAGSVESRLRCASLNSGRWSVIGLSRRDSWAGGGLNATRPYLHSLCLAEADVISTDVLACTRVDLIPSHICASSLEHAIKLRTTAVYAEEHVECCIGQDISFAVAEHGMESVFAVMFCLVDRLIRVTENLGRVVPRPRNLPVLPKQRVGRVNLGLRESRTRERVGHNGKALARFNIFSIRSSGIFRGARRRASLHVAVVILAQSWARCSRSRRGHCDSPGARFQTSIALLVAVAVLAPLAHLTIDHSGRWRRARLLVAGLFLRKVSALLAIGGRRSQNLTGARLHAAAAFGIAILPSRPLGMHTIAG